MLLKRITRRPRFYLVGFHVAMLLVTVALGVGVSAWAAGRSTAERNRMVRQQTAVATALTRAYAQILAGQLAAGAPATVMAADPSCALCIAGRSMTDGGASSVIDLTASLYAMVRAAGPEAIGALVGPDGRLRGLRPDGTSFTLRLRRTDPARVMAGDAVLDTFDMDDLPRTVVAAPIAPGLALVLGIDTSNRLAVVHLRHTQDGIWAGVTCLMLIGMAVASSLGVERAARRRQRLHSDQAALSLLNDELTAAHARVSRQNAELEATFAAMSDGVSYFDGDMRLVRWNSRVDAMTGVPPGVTRVGVPMADVLRAQAEAGEFGPLADPAAVTADVRWRIASIEMGVPLEVRERTRPNGTTIELRRTSLADGGFVTIYRDITDRKRIAAAHETARRLAERNVEEKSRFAAIVSHEIRTPLNVILNALGLMDRGGLGQNQRMLVETGLHAGEALLALVNDILDLSRLEAGRLPIVAAPFSPAVLVAGVADMYRTMAQQRGLDLAVSVADRVPPLAVADGGRLRQIVMNLVSNAAKFARPGTVTLAVDVLPGPPAQLRIAIRDSGPVIPAAARPRLFQPFSQLEQSSSAAAGSGLGLAICAMLAQCMGGSVAVDDTPPGGPPGNEFSIVIPLVLPVPDLVRIPPEKAAGPSDAKSHDAESHDAESHDTGLVNRGWRLPRARILVVEDIDANRWLLATMLRRDGHYVEAVASGPDALALVLSVPFDVVLMDVSMPGMDGMQATRRLRSLPGPAGSTKVIGVTANTSGADHARYIAAGMAAVLTKPVRIEALRAAVDRHVWSSRHPAADAGQEASESDVLDRSRLRGIPGADGLLRACLTELADQHDILVDAARHGNVAVSRATAHAMAGAAANHGFTALAAATRRLMDIKAMGKLETGLVDATTAALDAVRLHVEAMAPDSRREAGLVGATGIEPVTLRV